jgi:hypothetical protein
LCSARSRRTVSIATQPIIIICIISAKIITCMAKRLIITCIIGAIIFV